MKIYKLSLLSLFLLIVVVASGCTMPWQKGTSEKSHSSGVLDTIKDRVSGNAFKCVIENIDEKGNKIHGVMYVDSSRKRFIQDLILEGQGDIHIINDGTYLYSWNTINKKALNQGQKMNIEDMKKMSGNDTSMNFFDDIKDERDIPKDEKIGENGHMSCKPYSFPTSKLNPPSNINFHDFNEQFKNLKGKLKDQFNKEGKAKLNTCDLCDLLPDGPDKKTCLKECK